MEVSFLYYLLWVFFDYALFSDKELGCLQEELDKVRLDYYKYSDNINEISRLVEKAKELNICVLFDPFRDLKISDQSIVRV